MRYTIDWEKLVMARADKDPVNSKKTSVNDYPLDPPAVTTLPIIIIAG